MAEETPDRGFKWSPLPKTKVLKAVGVNRDGVIPHEDEPIGRREKSQILIQRRLCIHPNDQKEKQTNQHHPHGHTSLTIAHPIRLKTSPQVLDELKAH